MTPTPRLASFTMVGTLAVPGVGPRFSLGVGVLLTALIIPPLLARIRAEETLLRTQFGGEYEDYCSRTSRLISGF